MPWYDNQRWLCGEGWGTANYVIWFSVVLEGGFISGIFYGAKWELQKPFLSRSGWGKSFVSRILESVGLAGNLKKVEVGIRHDESGYVFIWFKTCLSVCLSIIYLSIIYHVYITYHLCIYLHMYVCMYLCIYHQLSIYPYNHLFQTPRLSTNSWYTYVNLPHAGIASKGHT